MLELRALGDLHTLPKGIYLSLLSLGNLPSQVAEGDYLLIVTRANSHLPTPQAWRLASDIICIGCGFAGGFPSNVFLGKAPKL